MGTFMSKFSQASSRFNKTGETNLHNNGPVDPNKDKKSGDNSNINIDKRASNVVMDVIIVLDKVSFIEIFVISNILISEYFFKFSLTLSKITTVSFIE